MARRKSRKSTLRRRATRRMRGGQLSTNELLRNIYFPSGDEKGVDSKMIAKYFNDELYKFSLEHPDALPLVETYNYQINGTFIQPITSEKYTINMELGSFERNSMSTSYNDATHTFTFSFPVKYRHNVVRMLRVLTTQKNQAIAQVQPEMNMNKSFMNQ